MVKNCAQECGAGCRYCHYAVGCRCGAGNGGLNGAHVTLK